MRIEEFTHTNTILLKQRNKLVVVLGFLLLTNLILALGIIFKEDKVFLVPSNLNQKVWLSNNSFSRHYLEEMSVFFVHLLMDVSSSSAPYQRDLVLRYASSDSHGRLKTKLIEEENRYSKESLATSFRIKKITLSGDGFTNLVHGDLVSYIADQKVKQERKVIKIKLTSKQGMVLLKDFKILDKGAK